MKHKVAVIFGGRSLEHEVSVITGIQVLEALRSTSYEALPIYISKYGTWFTGSYISKLEHYKTLSNIDKYAHPCILTHDDYGGPIMIEKRGGLKRNITHDIKAVIIACHGAEGENGSLQGVCETLNIPYSTCGVWSSAVCMDKLKTKKLCEMDHISVLPYVHFTMKEWETQQQKWIKDIQKLSAPWILKPPRLGSSIGICCVENVSELDAALSGIFRYSNDVLIESKLMPLMEVNTAVLVGIDKEINFSVCERPNASQEWLSFEDKYHHGNESSKGMAASDRELPANIPDSLKDKIYDVARQVVNTFELFGVVRLDFLIDTQSNKVYFNEANTVPGSLSFYLWDHSGLSFSELLEQLIKMAQERCRWHNNFLRSYDTNLLSMRAKHGLKNSKA